MTVLLKGHCDSLTQGTLDSLTVTVSLKGHCDSLTKGTL